MYKKLCFVIMPFSKTSESHSEQYWTDVFENTIKVTVEALGYKCIRSTPMPSNIMKDVIDNLLNAQLVIAVLTDNNVNVWYELGMRHVLKRGTIMIIQEDQSLAFDISQYGVVKYSDHFGVGLKFKNDLEKKILFLHEKSSPDSPFGDFLKSKGLLLKISTNNQLPLSKSDNTSDSINKKQKDKLKIIYIDQYSEKGLDIFNYFDKEKLEFKTIESSKIIEEVNSFNQYDLVILNLRNSIDILDKYQIAYERNLSSIIKSTSRTIAYINASLLKSVNKKKYSCLNEIIISSRDLIFLIKNMIENKK